jgi:hypothetical protein
MRTAELRRLADRLHMVRHRLCGIANTAEEWGLTGLAKDLRERADGLGALALAVDMEADEKRDRRGRR